MKPSPLAICSIILPSVIFRPSSIRASFVLHAGANLMLGFLRESFGMERAACNPIAHALESERRLNRRCSNRFSGNAGEARNVLPGRLVVIAGELGRRR